MPTWPSRSNHIGEGILNQMGLINRQCSGLSPIPRVTTEREGIRTLGWHYPPQPAYTGCCLNQRQPLRIYYSAILRSFDLRNSTALSSLTVRFVNSVQHLACLMVSVRNHHEARTVEASVITTFSSGWQNSVAFVGASRKQESRLVHRTSE